MKQSGDSTSMGIRDPTNKNRFVILIANDDEEY